MTGSGELLGVYASGRRLHELMSLADWGRATVTFAGSPITEEANAGRVRYQHLAAATTAPRCLVTNVLDAHVLDEGRTPGRVVVVAPLIIVETPGGRTDQKTPTIAAARPLLRVRADRGFEKVPFSTADTLGSGLETRTDHALSRLAYQIACGGVDVARLDGELSVTSTPEQVEATYVDSRHHFRVVLDDHQMVPMTLWAGGRRIYDSPGFSGCTIDYLVECARAVLGHASSMRCDGLYLDMVLALRRARRS